MRFTHEYSKLGKHVFTTIRKGTSVYRKGRTYSITTPSERFYAKVIQRNHLMKADITERFAQVDADCSRDMLIKQLEKWYGKHYDDFVKLKLERIEKLPNWFTIERVRATMQKLFM